MTAEEERAKREEEQRQTKIKQRKAQITTEINRTRSEINKLNAKIRQYETMEYKIKVAVGQLKEAKRNITKSNNELKSAYSSKIANQKSQNIQTSGQQTEKMISDLNNNILPQIKNKINNLKQNISAKYNHINNLQNEYNSLW